MRGKQSTADHAPPQDCFPPVVSFAHGEWPALRDLPGRGHNLGRGWQMILTKPAHSRTANLPARPSCCTRVLHTPPRELTLTVSANQGIRAKLQGISRRCPRAPDPREPVTADYLVIEGVDRQTSGPSPART